MSTGNWAPIEIPPGVVTKATKRMRSSNWAEVNAVRWRQGQLMPIGGQEAIGYSFASRCRAIHSWYDLTGVYYIAYLCEQNVYVDKGGSLTEITPADGLAPPSVIGLDGYGLGQYGMGLYGVPPRPGASAAGELSILPDVFSIDNFGALLLVMTSPDGRLLSWDPAAAAGTLLTQLTNAPPGRCFVVTSDRFVMVFGALTADGGGSLRRFAWCDQGNPIDWDYASVISQAGFLDIEPASPIICAEAGRSGWALFFTAKKAYVAQFLGLPFVYGCQELADDCTPWSPQSIVTTSSHMLWISQQGPFSYDGVSVTPVECQVWPWVQSDFDQVNVRWQAAAAHVAMHNEFWWMFPQNQQPANTRAVIYNYREGWWSQVQITRSAGITSSYVSRPIFADGVQPYLHENTAYFAGCDLPWAETFDLNLNSGGKLTTVKQMIVNVEGNASAIANLQYALYYKNSRLGNAPESVTPSKAVRPDGFVDFRTTGRDIRLRFQVAGPAVNKFTLGQHLIDAVPRGDR